MASPSTVRVRDRASGPAILNRVRRAPLSIRLALLLGSVTAAVVGAAFVAVSLGTRSRTRDLLGEQLGAYQRALLALQRETFQQELATSALIGEMPTLRAAMATYREEARSGRAPRAELLRTIQSSLDSVAAGLPQALLIVTDDDGKILGATDRSGTAPQTGVDLSTFPAVRGALDGTDPTLESSFAIASFHGAPFQLGCVPIIQNGVLRGVLLLGDRLDGPLLARLKRTLGSEVVVRGGSSVLATTVPGVEGGALAAGGTVNVGGETYVLASLPIGRDAAGAPVMLDLLHSVTSTTVALQGALSRSFLLYGFMAVALATLGAAVVARSELHPFRDFVRFMGAVAESRDYTRRFVDTRPTPEMRTLNDAYSQLIASLSESHAQLEARRVELTRANTVLRQEVEERQRAESALRERDEQLRQSQKLEAVGTLAGGVAHDFNNLLTVIHSYTELLMANVTKQDDTYADLEQIRQAASRAGRLTSQLLAFSRKQVMQPRVLDLAGVVSGVEKMLHRLIGEHIEMKTTSHGPLARVKADPGQVEQVVVNLVVNARDAMPRGGELILSTANVTITQPDAARYGETPSGPWVMLSVRDTGSGMDPVLLARIFEPFFTTKEVGQGTGLGLSMVYGIVKQSGGFIHVVSEPGKGSTFNIFLPAVEATDDDGVDGTLARLASTRGTETVLLVEDEDMVRALSERALRSNGYTVLSAANGDAALDLLEKHGGPVQLLLTDVVMPRMSGKELAEAVMLRYPGIRVLYMSGYTEDTIVHDGLLDDGVSLLQKPFTPTTMARRVREVLDHDPVA